MSFDHRGYSESPRQYRVDAYRPSGLRPLNLQPSERPPQLPPIQLSPRGDSFASASASVSTSTSSSQPDHFPASPRTPVSPHTPRHHRTYQHPSPTRQPSPGGTAFNDPTDNFPRPGKPSDPQNHDMESSIIPRPRSRGQSTSSHKSAATFASLPVRPSDHEYRIRNRNGTGATSSFPRPPLPPVNHWGAGPEDLRLSYRSQQSASTAQQTAETPRSSVVTKATSVASLAEDLSVEDIMGMYEKGFDDESDYEHERNRTGSNHEDDEPGSPSHPDPESTEITRRLTRTIQAFDQIHIPLATVEEPTHGWEQEPHPGSNGRGSPSPTTETLPSNDHHATRPRSPGPQPSPTQTMPMENSPVTNPPTPAPAAPAVATSSFPQEPPEEPGCRDRYGFRKKNQYITREQYDKWNSGYEDYLARRRKKWQQYLRENGLMTDNPNRFPPANTKTKRFIRKGIPPDWRGAAWFYYAGGPAILAKHGGVYDDMLKQPGKEVDIEGIERDLHRTFPDNIKFKPPGSTEEPAKIASLRRVLRAFSIFNPKIGYCQSLNFLAGMLLLFVETEEQVFWLLNIITRIYLPGTHEISLEGSKVDLGVLMQSLKESMPSVWARVGGDLENENRGGRFRRGTARRAAEPDVNRLPPITLSMTAWFMSCFIGTLPVEPTLRVWDVFFYEGSKTLFRISLTIFKLGESEIRALQDPMEMFELMQSLPRKLLDANAVMEACFKRRNGFGHLSQDIIDARRQERRDATRKETERMRIASEKPSNYAGLDGGSVGDKEGRKGMFGRRSRKGTMTHAARDRSAPPKRLGPD